jgi:hypothetical protein
VPPIARLLLNANALLLQDCWTNEEFQKYRKKHEQTMDSVSQFLFGSFCVLSRLSVLPLPLSYVSFSLKLFTAHKAILPSSSSFPSLRAHSCRAVCENPRALRVARPMAGQHKLYKIKSDILPLVQPSLKAIPVRCVALTAITLTRARSRTSLTHPNTLNRNP